LVFSLLSKAKSQFAASEALEAAVKIAVQALLRPGPEGLMPISALGPLCR